MHRTRVRRQHTDYLHCKFRPVVRARRHVLYFAEVEHAVYHPAEDDVLPVKEITLCSGDKELATVCVGAGIRLRS